MDRQNPSSSSPGFVYFNTNQEYHNKSDTADFLAFNDSPQASPPSHRFKPAYYSSPQSKFHRGSPRNYPQNSRRYQRWSGGSRSWNSSNNSSFVESRSLRENNQDPDMSKFIHPSFLEDPWAELEAKLKEQSQNSNEIDDSTNSEVEGT